MYLNVSLGSPRTWIAISLIALAMAAYPTPPMDPLLVPEPKRISWRRLLPSWRRAREERGAQEAEDFVAELQPVPASPPPPQRGRHRAGDRRPPIQTVNFPSFQPKPRADLDAYGVPWDPAPEPEPEPEPGADPQEPTPEPVRETARERLGKVVRPLDTWRPGDGTDPPTLVGVMLPAIDDSLSGYLGTWPTFDDEENQGGAG